MLNRIAHRAYSAYSADRWAVLNTAYTHLLHGQVHTALDQFRASSRSLIDLMGGDAIAWPLLSDDPHEASVSSALICLRGFCTVTKMWSSWPLLAEPVRTSPRYPSLAPVVRAQIEVGWAFANLSHLTPQIIIADLERVLAEVRDDDSADGRWARIVVHLALARAYNLTLQMDIAIDHAAAAVALNETSPHLLYSIFAHQETANAYYDAATLNDDDPALFAATVEAYERADAIVNRIGPEAWPLSCDYDRGWMYSRLEQFETAVEHFERAAFRTTGGGLLYDAGRCHYGLGYAFLNLKQHDAARKSLYTALDLFSDDDHELLNRDALGAGSRSSRMMALTLQILGLVDQDEGNLRGALEHLELSREHLLTVTNPASWYDTLMPLVEVCRALGEHEKASFYQAELEGLQERFPALPD